MRSTFFFAVLLFAVALAALLVARHRGATRSPRSPRGTATLVGDSLNVGVERYSPDALPRWRIVANDRVGRTTPEGIAELEAGRPRSPRYVVVSLGTNDSADARRRRSGPTSHGCWSSSARTAASIWATIWRDGAPNDAFNAVLRDAAAANRRVRLVEWADMVEAHPDWLADDGLHGNETGYRERARAVAAAVRSCAPAQTVTAR